MLFRSLERVRVAHDILEVEHNSKAVEITQHQVSVVRWAWHIISIVFLLFSISYGTLILYIQFGIKTIGK